MRKLSTDLIKSGSFTGSFSGSVIGTINSASYALTASTVLNAFSLTTGSTYSITASWSNYNISSSFSNTSTSSSYANTASNLSPVAQNLIPSVDSLYNLGSITNKWKDLYVSSGSIYIGDVVLTTSGSSIYANTQPIVTLNTASGQIEVSGITASLSSSFSTNAGLFNNTSSTVFATTGSNSFNGTQTVQGDVRVVGNLIAQQYIVSSSVSYFTSSTFDGSTKFGDSSQDTHQFTGSVLAPNITGSLLGSSSYAETSSLALIALTSSYINVATNAVSSSYAATASISFTAVSSSFSNTSSLANTASYVLNSVSSSFASTSSYNLNSVSSSYSLTASFASNAGSSLTTGSTYQITSSWSNNSISSSYAFNSNTSTTSSYATTSSYSINSNTATTASFSTNSVSASYSTTSSYAANVVSSSYALTASFAMNGGGGTTLVTGSTYPITSSWSNNAITASYALSGSGGSAGTSSIYYNVLLNNLYDNVLLTYERKNEQLINALLSDYGTGADGDITISTSKNINTDTISTGRSVADGVSYIVSSISSFSTSANITISGSSVPGVSVGDELLLINLQGDTTYYSNVGNFEILKVSSISNNILSFNVPISRSYGQTDNTTLGNQKIILQRIPNYSTVTISSGGVLTANSWNGTSGGVIAFKCNVLINSGSIHTNGKGFRFGVGGIRDNSAGCTQYPTPAPAGDRAESYRGLNSISLCSRLGRSATTSIGGGGGGGGGCNNGDTGANRSGGGGGGGANRTNGVNGSNSSYGVNLGASGGTAYNSSTSVLIFGGGGGGGGRAVNAYGANGGTGGGIVLIYANDFRNTSVIQSTGSVAGSPGTSDDGGGGGGGGAGGCVLIKSNYVNSLGTFSITGGNGSNGSVGSLYGTGGAGGAGGLGNQLLKYTVANVSVSSVTASFESSSISNNPSVDPNIEDGFVDNFYAYYTLSNVVSASWDPINKNYYNVTGSVNSLTSYPVRTISSSVKYPTIVRAIIFAENNDDDPWTINQDLKFYLSNNEGISYTTASLIKRGLYETGKFIYSNDISLISQNTASLTYKLEFSSSKVINLYGVGLVWPIDLTFISSSASASFATTSSYALTASFAMNGGSGGASASFATTSSYALTASFAMNGGSGGGSTSLTGITFPYVSGSNTYTLSQSAVAANDLLLSVNGVVQTPTTDYTVSASSVTFTDSYPSGSSVNVRYLVSATSSSFVNLNNIVLTGTTTGDAYYPQVSALLHFDGVNGSTVITDNSKNNLTVTATNGAFISTAQSKFGGSSVFLDGTNDYLSIPDNESLEPGTNNLTWEMWIKTTSSVQYATLYSRTPSSFASGMWSFMINQASSTAGDIALYLGDYSGGVTPLLLTTGVSIRDNVWHHIAIVRNGSAWVCYVDGTSRATGTFSGAISNISSGFIIGADQYYGRYFQGYIDEFRVTNGYARYTGNFTPSTTAFADNGGDVGKALVVNSTATGVSIGTAGFNLNSSNINRIINGAMAVDQRNAGASQTITAAAALAYTVDRWYAYCTGANVTGQRVAGTGNNQFAYRFTGAASVTAIGFGQRIEAANSIDLAGSTATLGVDLANSVLTSVTWTAYYANTADTFGTLASPTRTQISTGTFTITSTLTRYSAQIFIPSAAITGLEIVFSVGAQTSGTWTIDNVQLEAGPLATPFERRNIIQELANCQRYYSKSYAINTVPGTVTNSGCIAIEGLAGGPTFLGHSTRLAVPMRTTPSVTYYSPSSSTPGRIGYWSGTEISATTSYISGISGITDSSVSAQLNNVNTSAIYWHYVASAEL